jgi:hypothetical protein
MTQYKFLEAGDILDKGDEFVGSGGKAFKTQRKPGEILDQADVDCYHYRRRIHKAAKPNTAEKVKVRPTYRFLNPGETVLATDEWAQETEKFEDWEPVWASQVGSVYNNPSLKYRRKVGPEAVSLQPLSFIEELRNAINRHSKENGSNTPDFILAEFLNDALNSYDKSVKARDKWYGKELSPGGNNK